MVLKTRLNFDFIWKKKKNIKFLLKLHYTNPDEYIKISKETGVRYFKGCRLKYFLPLQRFCQRSGK